MKNKIGLQLYSVREKCSGDLEEVLKKVADIGYDGVEFYDFFGLDAKRLKTLLRDLGIESAGSHTATDRLENLDEVIRYNTVLETRYITLPGIEIKDRESLLKTCAFMNKTGETLRENGFDFLYHNHDYEFRQVFEGKTAMEILMESTDPKNVSFELDCYWVKYAGLDPVKYLKEHIGRIKTIHMKDMADSADQKMTEIGAGIMDCKALAGICTDNHFEWIIAEQDEITIDPYESIGISLHGLKKCL